MPTFRDLDDLDVWLASKKLVVEIYRITNQQQTLGDRAFCDQARRAALSISLNIAEGLGRQTDKEFAHFLHIARGSALETKSLLSIGLELGFLDKGVHAQLEEAVSHIIAQLSSLSQYLRGIQRRKDMR